MDSNRVQSLFFDGAVFQVVWKMYAHNYLTASHIIVKTKNHLVKGGKGDGLGPVYTRSDPNGFVPKTITDRPCVYTGLDGSEPTWICYPYPTGSLSKVIPLGFDLKNGSCKRVGSDPSWYG